MSSLNIGWHRSRPLIPYGWDLDALLLLHMLNKVLEWRRATMLVNALVEICFYELDGKGGTFGFARYMFQDSLGRCSIKRGKGKRSDA